MASAKARLRLAARMRPHPFTKGRGVGCSRCGEVRDMHAHVVARRTFFGHPDPCGHGHPACERYVRDAK